MNRRIVMGLAGLLLLGAGCSSTARTSVGGGGSDDVLDLSGQGLKTISSSVFQMTDLEELDLSDNQLTGALPGEIRFLEKLRVLDVSGNAMTGVPAEIGQLSSLEELDLSDNQLTGLPLELGNLENLRVLDLSGNDVSSQDLEAIRARLENTNIIL